MRQATSSGNSLAHADLQPIFDWLAEAVAEGIVRASTRKANELVETDPRNETNLLLTVDQVAEILNVPPRRVYELAKSGNLPSVRIGRLVRFSRRAIEDWMARLERKSVV